MEEIRQHYVTNLRVEIKSCVTYIQKHEQTIIRMKLKSDVFSISQIDKLQSRIDQLNTDIDNLNSKITDIKNGEYDDQFKRTSDENKTQHKQKPIKSDKQKKNESKKLYTSHWKIHKENQRTIREMDSTERYFHKIKSKIPDFLLKKLNKMPNNRGYIFRGMWLFGNKKPERDKQGNYLPDVLFERINKDLLRIRESDKKEVRIYEKYGNKKRVLVSKMIK